MKKKAIQLLAIILCVNLLLSSCTRMVKIYECKECEVFTEKGITLDAKVYKREVYLSPREKKHLTEEYTLVLGNSINDKKIPNLPFGDPKHLLFYPEFTIVAVPNHPIEQHENYIEHEDIKEEAIVIVKADTLNVHREGYAIHKIDYSPTQIKFNSFGKIKAFGDSVIVKLK